MVKDRSIGNKIDDYQKVSTDEITDKNTQKIEKVRLLDKMFYYTMKSLNLVSFILILISVYLYKESLRGCFDSQAECLKNMNEGEVRELLGLISKSAFFLALIITGCNYSLIHKLFYVLITLVYGYLCFYYDVGADLDYHGAYNRVILLLIFVLWFLLLNIVIIIYKGFKRFPIVTFILVILIIFSIFNFYRFRVRVSCRDWNKGLSGVTISSTNMPCKLSEPDECWIDVLDGFFDYSGLFKDDCSIIRNGDRILYDKYFEEKNPEYTPTSLIGFPRTENYTYSDSIHFVLDYKIMRELIDMNDPNVPESVKNRTEIMIDYRGESSKVIIKIARDEDLVKQRLPFYKKFGKNLLAKNIMIIYIDALSRRHFMRKMKKTAKWIEKFHHKEDGKFASYEFMKYHSLGYFTQINTVPAFLGKWWLQSGGNYYTKYWKEKGAITSQSVSFCGRELFDFENDQFRDMNWEPYDHENIALYCDPNYNQADNPYTPFLGAYSVRRRCIHGKDAHDYQLEYGYKFWAEYSDMPKVMRMDFIDAHEGSMEVVKYLDDKLEKYLVDLEQNNMLDDTILLFMADHGNNMPGFVSLMDSLDWKIEKYLPMMFVVVPEKLNKSVGKNLLHNEQSIVTAWDIHNTLLHAAGAPINSFNPHGSSFFKKIENNRFNCRKFLIKDDFCVCK